MFEGVKVTSRYRGLYGKDAVRNASSSGPCSDPKKALSSTPKYPNITPMLEPEGYYKV